MAESKTVQVKLRARGWVNNEIREAGATVELPELADDGQPFAVSFGDIVASAAPAAPEKADDAK